MTLGRTEIFVLLHKLDLVAQRQIPSVSPFTRWLVNYPHQHRICGRCEIKQGRRRCKTDYIHVLRGVMLDLSSDLWIENGADRTDTFTSLYLLTAPDPILSAVSPFSPPVNHPVLWPCAFRLQPPHCRQYVYYVERFLFQRAECNLNFDLYKI